MVNLMNIVALQESAGTGHPVAAAGQKSNGLPETQGLFAILLQALQSFAQPVTDGGPVPIPGIAGSDPAAGETPTDGVVSSMWPPTNVKEPQEVETTAVPQPDSAAVQPVAGSVISIVGTETIAVAGAAVPIAVPVPAVNGLADAVLEQTESAPAVHARAGMGLSRIPGMPVSLAVERLSPDTAGGGSGVQPSGERMLSLYERLVAGRTDGGLPSRDGSVVAVPEQMASAPATHARLEVALRGVASFQMHSVGEGQQTLADMAAAAAPAGEHLAAPVLRETGNGQINLRAAPISAAWDTAQRTDGSPDMRSFDPGGRGTDAQTAAGTGTAVQSQPTTLAESVGAAQPEIDGLVREKFTILDRTAAGQMGLAGQDTGRGSVSRVGRAAPVGRSTETPAPLVDQVMKVVRVLTNEQRSEMRIRMWPPNLGELNVRLVHEGDILRVQLAAETGAARDLLEARLPQLRQALVEIGGSRNDVSVTVTAAEQPAFAAFTANHGAGHTPYQQGGRPHGPPAETAQHAELPDESAGNGFGMRPAVTAGHIDVHA